MTSAARTTFDVRGTEREPDGQVVDAQRGREDDEAPETGRAVRRGHILRPTAPEVLHESEQPRHAEDDTGHQIAVVTQSLGDGVAEEQAEQRHGRFERAEGGRHFEAPVGASTRDSEGRRRAVVVEPHRERDEQQGEHARMLGGRPQASDVVKRSPPSGSHPEGESSSAHEAGTWFPSSW